MKDIIKINFFCIILCLIITSCNTSNDDGENDIIPPGEIANISISDTLNGGLIFSYDLPSDNDIHYVKLRYTIGEKTIERVASYLADSIKIEGLPDTNERTYEFIAGDRTGNESEITLFKASCKTPPHQMALESSQHHGDYGGAKIIWENKSEQWVYLNIEYIDDKGIPVQQLFKNNSPIDSISIGSRWKGEKSFTYYFADRYDNRSEVKKATVKVLPALEIPHEDMKLIYLKGDIEQWNDIKIPFNGNKEERFLTTPNGAIIDFNIPYYCTIDLGRKAQISKMILYGHPTQYYAHYKADCIKEFEIYGTTEELTTGQDPNSVNWKLIIPKVKFAPQFPHLSSKENMEKGFTINTISTEKMRYLRLKLISRYSSSGWYGRYHVGSEWVFLGDYDN